MRRHNPMRENEHWGRAAATLAQIIAGDPARAAQIEADQTRALSQQQADRFARGDRKRRIAGAEAWDDPRVSAMVASGDSRLQHIGDVLLAERGSQAVRGDVTPDQLRFAQAGAGRDPSEALTRGEFDAVSARDAQQGLRETLGERQLMERGETERAGLRENSRRAIAGMREDSRQGIAAAELAQAGSLGEALAMEVQAGNLDPETAAAMLQPRSLEQVLAGQVSGGARSMDEASVLRGWRDDPALAGGAAGGAPGGAVEAAPEPLSDAQRNAWAQRAEETLNQILTEQGVDPGAFDPLHREEVLNYVLREAPRRPDSSPHALTAEAVRLLGIEAEGGGWFSDPSVTIGNPAALIPRPGGQRTPSAPGEAVPPPAERVVGRTYRTPRGPAVWEGTGWRLAGER